MAGPVGLTSDDFARMVVEALPNVGVIVSPSGAAQLQLGDTSVSWRYPAVIHGVHGKHQVLVVPRFGSAASIPGHIKKYLHACRVQLPNCKLYIAAPEHLWSGYSPLCALFGLGAYTISMDDGRMTTRLKPTKINIDKAFAKRVREAVDAGRNARDERLAHIAKARIDFNKQLSQTQGLSPNAYNARFDNVESEVERAYQQLVDRAREVLENGNLEGLHELALLTSEINST